MVERNLIKEGFVTNTLTPLGAISGSQVLTVQEMANLANDDISTTAVLASGSEFFSVDADLGARFKLNKIEVYTDEPTSSNLIMNISDDGAAFFPVTMTGSAGLYVGDISPTTISGAPRYIRYEHRPSVDRLVREWTVISDDALVDFGGDGSQTQLEITDAPVGKPSDQVATLTIANQFSKPAVAFVFIERTFNDAEDQIEISTSASGPWVGRSTSDGSQPNITPWEEGTFFQTRVVPTGVLFVNFTDGDDKDWDSFNTDNFRVEDGVLKGESNDVNPGMRIINSFDSFRDDVTRTSEEFRHRNKFAFAAKDADRVIVRARGQQLSVDDLVEGPRLYWQTQEVEGGPDTLPNGFRTALSTTSLAVNSNYNGSVQTFTFDVGNIPTWSGVVRSFLFQPFTSTTGINIPYELHSLEVLDTTSAGGGQPRVAIEFNPVESGTFNEVLNDDATTDSVVHQVLSFRHRVTQDTIITNVQWYALATSSAPKTAVFLARPLSGSSFPSVGTNFEIVHAIRTGEENASSNNQFDYDVFWSAKAGDIIGFTSGGSSPRNFKYKTSSGSTDAYRVSTGASDASLTDIQTGVNSVSWNSAARSYHFRYTAVPNTSYKAFGTYRTPVFDAGVSPAVGTLDFDSVIVDGTSINSNTAFAFDTVNARAVDAPPLTSLALGDDPEGGFNVFLNEARYLAADKDHESQINVINNPVSSREGSTVQNVGCGVLYHQTKGEVWVLNLLASGVAPTNIRPSWDAFDPVTGNYLRTEMVGGAINYSYQHPLSSAQREIFEGVGFVADYDREEIYIVQRENAFFVGQGSYYGIVLDLDGNFKEVFFRDGVIGEPDSNRFENMRALAYDDSSKHFFILTSSDNGDPDEGELVVAIENGSSTTGNNRTITFVNETSVAAIPGLSFAAANDPDAKGLVYDRVRGSLIFQFENETGSESVSNKPIVLYEVQHTLNGISEEFEYVTTGLSAEAPETAPRVDGYTRQGGSADATNMLTQRNRDFTMGMAYNGSRDTYLILRNYRAEFTDDYPELNFVMLNRRSLTFLGETAAGNNTSYGVPGTPNAADPRWGSVSGTLAFQPVAVSGVLFPTGRFSQIEYRLNSNSDGTESPTLTSSKLGLGLNAGPIPANGTTNIFVRTNIPEDQPIGDQLGRLKVFFQLEE